MLRLNVFPKNGKYTVKDTKNRVIYNIKKPGLGGKLHLMDSSGYKLYYMTSNPKDKKPIYSVYLNDNVFFEVRCTSMFLDPSFKVVGKAEFDIVSQDRHEFRIMNGEQEVGKILSPERAAEQETENGGEASAEESGKKGRQDKTEPYYVLNIENNYFDDYVPLFVVCIEETFGKLNKSQ